MALAMDNGLGGRTMPARNLLRAHVARRIAVGTLRRFPSSDARKAGLYSAALASGIADRAALENAGRCGLPV